MPTEQVRTVLLISLVAQTDTATPSNHPWSLHRRFLWEKLGVTDKVVKNSAGQR